MPVVIEDSLLRAAHLDESEFKREIALALYAQERLTLAQASRFANMPYMDFQGLLADRDICIHYDSDDLRSDVETLRGLRKT